MSAFNHHLVRRGHIVAHQVRSVIESHAPSDGGVDVPKSTRSALALGLIIVASVVLVALAIIVRDQPLPRQTGLRLTGLCYSADSVHLRPSCCDPGDGRGTPVSHLHRGR